MNTISNMHAAGQSVADGLRSAHGPREVSTAAAPVAAKTGEEASSAATFEHQAKESAGKYWVETAKDGPQIRFEKPTTAAAEAKGMQKTVQTAAPQNTDTGSEVPRSTGQTPATASSAETVEPEESAAKASEPKEPEEPEDNKEDPKQKARTTTCNTDAVDRELEMLRAKAQKLEQAARGAGADNETKTELADVERELAMKDNDAYRRAHARFT